MVNRAAGEIYKTSSILAQTFGETVATAFGLVFYQKSDGKLYRALANAAATVAGKLFVCLDAATVEDRPGNVLAQGSSRRPVGHGPWENWSTSRRPWPAD